MDRFFKVEPVSFSIILTQKQQEKKEGKLKENTQPPWHIQCIMRYCIQLYGLWDRERSLQEGKETSE